MIEKRPKVGIGVLVLKEGRVLLGKRKGSHGSGLWAPSGGHLEFGESVEVCAERELREETGLQPLHLELGPWTSDLIEADKHYVSIFVFIPKFLGEPQLLEPAKCEGWEWFEWENLPDPLFPPIQSLIRKVGIAKLKNLC